jgi:hypothetical protein
MHTKLIAMLFLVLAPPALAQDSGSITCSTDRFLGIYEDSFSSTLSFLDVNTVLASQGYTLETYDISDPANITQLFQLPVGSNFQTMDVYEGYAYICDGFPGRLIVVDVQNPSALSIAAEISLPNSGSYSYNVTVDNQIAYVAAPGRDIFLFDVSDPTSPISISIATPKQNIIDMQALGSFLYVRSTELYIFDYSDPLNPMLRGTFESPNGIRSMHIEDSNAYIGDGSGRVMIIDVAQPDNPTVLGQLDVPGVSNKIQRVGNRLYFAGTISGIHTIDITDPANMSIVGHTLEAGSLKGIIANQSQIVSARSQGLTVIDADLTVAPPPAQVFSITGDNARGIAIEGNYAFVSGYLPGVTIFDITSPFAPIKIASVPTSSVAYRNSIKVEKGIMYIAENNDGVGIFDVSDPFNPTLIGQITDNEASGLDVQGDRLAIYSVEPGFVALYDIVDPANPILMSTHSGPEYPGQVILREDKIYVAGGYTTLVVIDATDPTNLTTAGIYDSPGIVEFSVAIALEGDTAFVCTDFGKLYAVEITNPNNPQLISTHPLNYDTYAIETMHDRLIASSSGVHLYDISDPANIQWISAALGVANDLSIVDNTMFAASGLNGLWVLDIGDCVQCIADFNDDGQLNFFDISLFLEAFMQAEPAADLNNDAQVNFFDISLFLIEFNIGCP